MSNDEFDELLNRHRNERLLADLGVWDDLLGEVRTLHELEVLTSNQNDIPPQEN